jgi:hypothetical protein
MHSGKVRARADRFKKTQRERFSVAILLTFEKCIFKTCEHPRDTKFALVGSVVVAVNGAPDRASFTVLPILTVNNFIRRGVLAHAPEVLRLQLRLTMVGD